MNIPDLLAQIEAELKPLYREYTLSEWEAAVNGTPEALRRQQDATAAWMRYWADPERFALLARLQAERQGTAEPPAGLDPLQARQLQVLYLSAAENQQDEAAIREITTLEAAIRDQYYNFRGVVRGEPVSDNVLDEYLAKSNDSDLVRDAWEASKQIGFQVADSIRALARARNRAAQRQGFRDYFERQLRLSEIDEAFLLRLFAELERATDAPFAVLKARIDAARAAHFGLDAADLRPWHYGDRFFQSPPETGGVNLDAVLAEHDPVDLALKTYTGLGMDVSDILARSDLYARPGKNQHAFCIHIDREGDVRTLNNLERNHRWTETLLHELGHGVYDKYLDYRLPWLLRSPPHTLSTEAIAVLMGSLTYDADWLAQVAGVPAAMATEVAAAGREQERAGRLIFTRWVLVMTHFERALYADPEGDLNAHWWGLVERFQGLARPEGRDAPDWAAKIHIALYPVYYHNYELGHLITAQLQHKLRALAGGMVGRPAAGQWLRERFFAPGNRQVWDEHVAAATGEPLNPGYFVATLAG